MKISNVISVLLGLAAAGLILFAATARAEEVVVSATTVTETSGVSDVPLTFFQFNPSYGTLDSITISLVNNISSTLGVINTGTTSASFSSLEATVLTNIALSTNGDDTVVSGTTIDVDPTGNVSVPPSTTTPENYQAPLVSSNFTATSLGQGTLAGDLSNFIGNGTIQLFLNLPDFPSGTYGGQGDLGLGYTGSDSDTATVTVTYNYEGVPEPLTFGEFGLGAGILFIVIRRKLARIASPILSQ